MGHVFNNLTIMTLNKVNHL